MPIHTSLDFTTIVVTNFSDFHGLVTTSEDICMCDLSSRQETTEDSVV